MALLSGKRTQLFWWTSQVAVGPEARGEEWDVIWKAPSPPGQFAAKLMSLETPRENEPPTAWALMEMDALWRKPIPDPDFWDYENKL